MIFPPIKPDRAVLMITLNNNANVETRFSQLRDLLKSCRLHPLDTTGSAQIVIIGTDAFREQQDKIQATLGPGDLLHLITTINGRLSVEVIAGSEASQDAIEKRPSDRRPPWLREG